MIIKRIRCNHCGRLHINILTSTGEVQCIGCHKWIDIRARDINPNRCKYCNEVIFKDSHKGEDCAMKPLQKDCFDLCYNINCPDYPKDNKCYLTHSFKIDCCNRQSQEAKNDV